jgi:hypothetical protein
VRTDREAASRERYAKGEVSMDFSGLRQLLVELGVRTYDSRADALADRRA